MLDAVSYFNFPDVWAERARLEDHEGDGLNRQLRANRPLPTTDGWILVTPVGGKQMAATLEALGIARRKAELKAVNGAAAVAAQFFEWAEERTPLRTSAEWMSIFEQHDVPAAVVLTIDEHLDDDQIVHNETYESYDDPVLGAMRGVRYPARFASGQAPVRPAPKMPTSAY